MRVLLPTTDFPPTRGGIQTMLGEFTRRTSAELTVVAPADPGYRGVDDALPARVVRVRSIGIGGRRGFLPGLARATMREARRSRPDVVFAGHVLAAPAAVRLRRRGIPLVVAIYGRELFAPRVRRVAAWVLPRADRILAISRFTMTEATGLGADPAHTALIGCGAPVPREVSPEALAALRSRCGLNGARVILTVARLAPHKGIDVVARALASLPGDVRLLVVGDGPARGAFETAARDAGVADRVVFAGALSDDDLAAAYRLADVFALASRTLDGGRGGVEGFGITLLEAGAYGLPVVASRTGGIQDAVIDGQTGILVDPERIPDVAAALNRALDPSVAKQMGAAAEKAARTERNWSAVVEKMQEMLADAAGVGH